MTRTSSILAMFVVVVSVTLSESARAQTDFFWSTHDLNAGAANGDVNVEYETGDTGSLFLYYTTNGPIGSDIDTGAFLDVSVMTEDVIQFTGAEAFDFSISIGGVPVVNRYLDQGGGGGGLGVNNLSDDLIDGWFAFTVAGGQGILDSNTGPVFFDNGYDAASNAFLWGRIDFLVVGAAGESTRLDTRADEVGIVNQGQAIFPTFGDATLTIVDSSVPEPTTLGFLTVGLFALVVRRDRD